MASQQKVDPLLVGFLAGAAAVGTGVAILWQLTRKPGESSEGPRHGPSLAAKTMQALPMPRTLPRTDSEKFRASMYMGDQRQLHPVRADRVSSVESFVVAEGTAQKPPLVLGTGGDADKVQRTSVTVRVPATTANMGPGFDTIGMCLDMWSEFTVSLADEFELTNEGDGADDCPTDETNLVCVGLRKAYGLAGKAVPPLHYKCVNRIPYARGLGSSSAAIVGGIIAGLMLSGHRLSCWGAEELLQIACSIEGHPDNVAPAIYGGIQLGIFAESEDPQQGKRWWTERVNLPAGLQIVIFIPDFVGKTSDARRVLPKDYKVADVVYNIGRIAWLVNALATNNLNQLKFGVQDSMHQPQRGSIYKHLDPMIAAATAAGAACCYLSGAGPSVLAITTGAAGDIFAQREKERVDRKVADAMIAAAADVGVRGQVFITEPSLTGAYVASVEPPFSGGLVSYKGDV